MIDRSHAGGIFTAAGGCIEPAMVAFTSLEPVRAFAAIMVLAPLLLMLMLAMSITTENPKPYHSSNSSNHSN